MSAREEGSKRMWVVDAGMLEERQGPSASARTQSQQHKICHMRDAATASERGASTPAREVKLGARSADELACGVLAHVQAAVHLCGTSNRQR